MVADLAQHFKIVLVVPASNLVVPPDTRDDVVDLYRFLRPALHTAILVPPSHYPSCSLVHVVLVEVLAATIGTPPLASLGQTLSTPVTLALFWLEWSSHQRTLHGIHCT